MRTLPVFRRGRRVYHDGTGQWGQGPANNCVSYCLGVVFFVLIFVGAPFYWITAERTYRDLLESFAEVKDEIVALNGAQDGQIVHFQSSSVDANVSDLAFGVELHGALRLSRNTEYCQWEEHQTTQKDAENRTYTEYSYVKMWRSRRIPSAFFDQPAAHHNPQRDPFPSDTFVASIARAGVEDGGEALVARELLTQTRAPWRSVDWTLGALPRESWSWWPWKDRTRYAAIASLSGAETSLAARSESFVYVGQGGYFFSPYTATTSGLMFKYFMQYVEGSLLDWQLGDLMPSCTAGDLRVSYSVQDPREISVVGKVTAIPAKRERFRLFGSGSSEAKYRISFYTTPKGHQLGMVHAGFVSVDDMMDAEVKRQLLWCLLARALLLLPVSIVTSLLKLEWFAAVGPWAFCVAGLWIALFGLDIYATAFLALSAVVVAITWSWHQKAKVEREKVKENK